MDSSEKKESNVDEDATIADNGVSPRSRNRETLQTLDTLSTYRPNLYPEESDTHPEEQNQPRRSKESSTVAPHSSSGQRTFSKSDYDGAAATETPSYATAAAASASTAHFASVDAPDDISGKQQVKKSHKTFEQRLEDLKSYKAMYGNCNVPKKYSDDPSLGPFCNRMRIEYKKGKLREDRIKSLSDIGFNWALKKGEFDKKLQELGAFIKDNKNVNVSDMNQPLARWYLKMRKALKKYYDEGVFTEDLTDQRIQMLENAGLKPSE